MTSCTCFSPGSGEGCPAAPTGTFPLSGPEGSPGAAPHCPADTACPEPGLTASRRAKRGAGRGAWHRGPSLHLLEVRASQPFREPLRVCHWGFFQTLHLISSKDAVRSAKPSADGADSHEGPARTAGGGERAGRGPGLHRGGDSAVRGRRGASLAGEQLEQTIAGQASGSTQIPAGPGTARDTPAHPGTPRSCAAARVPRRCWEPRRQLLLRTPAGRVC